ncbi:adenylate/guanylate cyclase domain-containing protein [Ramlibacter alkalitolerans]|uniref:Adenylate/guanylate cyclase domain-containing protein n=1 Tax=Ramlibacter alkalitolerans TaxID=2039631 RepID=A0ABS1JHU3_9BURK|nr:adenylate/guanylate cyclase domain-containing protein [Ramlibacter alkalitolerans]MBL0423784.1 adenylate/guanylate cyclase domain-containing protein [Ramlibacter alkalitolerans]
MAATPTVMFADLTGSTGVFEKFGNEAATRTVTALTDWIAEVCRAHGGRVVKTLGDGVLATFPAGADAIEAAVQMQREHARRSTRHGLVHRLQLQVGLACGEVVEVAADCFGDAVNVAARLSNLSGARQILATESVVQQVASPAPGTRFHPLGSVPVRGREQEIPLFRIDWEEDASTDMMTIPAFDGPAPTPFARPAVGAIELHFLENGRVFSSDQLPVHLGRAREAEFLVPDPRVSRLHARIVRHYRSFVLVDLSSNGTCVRFQGAPTPVSLRRNECVLHDSGEIALGPDFGDWSVPTVRFELRLR